MSNRAFEKDRETNISGITSERRRIQAEIRRRDREKNSDFDEHWHPAELLARTEARRMAVTMLSQAGTLPTAGDACLEIGCGSRGWLGAMIDWGVREIDLHGIELDPISAKQAQEILPLADLRVGDATHLPWSDSSFRLVISSTVFTSILNPVMRKLVADEITRALAPGGALLWYDFSFNNPSNPNVRKVSRTELLQLFPYLKGKIKSIELAPPLSRIVAPRSQSLAYLLGKIPLLRTHLMAVLVKPP